MLDWLEAGWSFLKLDLGSSCFTLFDTICCVVTGRVHFSSDSTAKMGSSISVVSVWVLVLRELASSVSTVLFRTSPSNFLPFPIGIDLLLRLPSVLTSPRFARTYVFAFVSYVGEVWKLTFSVLLPW